MCHAPWCCVLLIGALTACAVAADPRPTHIDAKRRTQSPEWRSQPVRYVEQLPGFALDAPLIPRTPYGGRADRQLKATGHFRVQQVGDRWWVIDPAGSPWYAMGVCSVRMNGTQAGVLALEERHGTPSGWADQTHDLLRRHCFTMLGAWSQEELLGGRDGQLPYTLVINFMAEYARHHRQMRVGSGHYEYPRDCIPVFDPEFDDFCRRLAWRRLGPHRKDPYLLGFFSDNELPFHREMLERYLALPKGDVNRAAAEKWCADQQVDPAAGKFTDQQRGGFLKRVAATYFKVVRQATREVVPHHLYLGCRLHGSILRYPEVFEAAGPHVDIVSVNYYHAWQPSPEWMTMWAERSGRPFMVSEFYAKGMDSGLTNVSGAGFTVKTQADRGRFYQTFTLGLLEHPGCVGWQWFRYMDNDLTNTWADDSNRDANKGIVNHLYEPWTELLTRMKAVNGRAYRLIDYFDGERAKAAAASHP